MREKRESEKKKSKAPVVKATVSLIIIIALFAATSYYARENTEYLRSLVSSSNITGIFIYIIVFAISIIIAPVSSLPLMPLGAQIWGWFPSAIYSVIGWVIGDFIAFMIAREYGKPLVKKLISLKSIERFEKLIPDEHMFMSIIILRIIIPIDGVSYALGLFSSVKIKIYLPATIIGLLPFALAFSYLGTLSFQYQIMGGLVSLILTVLLIIIGVYRKKRREKTND